MIRQDYIPAHVVKKDFLRRLKERLRKEELNISSEELKRRVNAVANPDFSPDCVTGGGGALRLGLVGPARPPGGLGTRRFVLLDGSHGPAGGGEWF